MFDIRPYAKAELASLYSPHVAPDSAMKTLKRWINGCPLLVEELRALRYQPHRHSFLKPEVEANVRHLGEPCRGVSSFLFNILQRKQEVFRKALRNLKTSILLQRTNHTYHVSEWYSY